MKIIINMPGQIYNRIALTPRCASLLDAYNDRDMFVKAIQNGTPLPDNSTNGDMIKAMFPNTEIEGIGGLEGLQCVAVSIGLGTSYFALDWWNAPYKAESEE